MPLRLSTFGLLTAASLLVTSMTGARAADLDDNYGYADAPQDVPVAAIPQTKVEFGTGWYVRGDIAATRLPEMGLANSPNSAPNVTLKDGSQYGYDASLGFGYEFNKWFRSDVGFDFHKPIGIRAPGLSFPASNNYKNSDGITPDASLNNTSGTCQVGYITPSQVSYPYYSNCNSQYQATIQSFDVLVNGYAQLGQFGIVSPYVGAGAGLSFGHYASAIAYYLNDGTHYDTTFPLPGSSVSIHGYADKRISANYYNFAFALMAGVSFDIYNHTKLDVGYRYLNLGQILGSTVQYNEIRAGLRYMIDN